MNKFFAKKFTAPDGERFDSRAEWLRWLELQKLQQRGAISGLRRQVAFTLLPRQTGEDGKVLERPVGYTADFVYVDQGGQAIAEDVKSEYTRKEKDYVMRRKLFRYVHGRLYKFVETIR